jgi:hypothetical protein
MRSSLAAFLSFLVVGLTFVALEAVFLAARFDQFQARIAQNSEMTFSLAKREAALQSFKLNKDAFENKAALLLTGYTPEPIAIGADTFGDLFSLGVQISPQEEPANKGAKIWTYKLTSAGKPIPARSIYRDRPEIKRPALRAEPGSDRIHGNFFNLARTPVTTL